jgi:hypothetical protein
MRKRGEVERKDMKIETKQGDEMKVATLARERGQHRFQGEDLKESRLVRGKHAITGS